MLKYVKKTTLVNKNIFQQQKEENIIFSPLIPHITYSLQIIFFKKIWRYSFQIGIYQIQCRKF